MGRGTFPENFRITHELIAEIEHDLILRGAGKWSNVQTEMQDEGRSVLITLEVPKGLSDKALSEYKTILASVVGPRIPEDIDGLGSWCICIKCEGKTIDAVVSFDYKHDEFGNDM